MCVCPRAGVCLKQFVLENWKSTISNRESMQRLPNGFIHNAIWLPAIRSLSIFEQPPREKGMSNACTLFFVFVLHYYRVFHLLNGIYLHRLFVMLSLADAIL